MKLFDSYVDFPISLTAQVFSIVALFSGFIVPFLELGWQYLTYDVGYTNTDRRRQRVRKYIEWACMRVRKVERKKKRRSRRWEV